MLSQLYWLCIIFPISTFPVLTDFIFNQNEDVDMPLNRYIGMAIQWNKYRMNIFRQREKKCGKLIIFVGFFFLCSSVITLWKINGSERMHAAIIRSIKSLQVNDLYRRMKGEFDVKLCFENSWSNSFICKQMRWKM
jgi:hypothetical protein